MTSARRLALCGTSLALALAPAAALAAGTQKSAETQCRQERTAMGQAVFRQTYASNKNRRDAFGKCVSHRTKQDSADQAKAQSNAAQQCRAEQQKDAAAFKAKYGTNKNRRNAFGRCVSSTARAHG